MPFIATMNTPTYLPWSDDEPPLFETAAEAWQFLAEERERQEDATDVPEYTETLSTLRQYVDDAHGANVVYGDTPGYEGSHDLGVAYSVTELPIEATRCPCCGDDVMDVKGIACKECRTEGCEASYDASGERGYWGCQRPEELHMHYGASRRLCGADTGMEGDATETVAAVNCPDCIIELHRAV